MIPIMTHSGKGKTAESEKDLCVAKDTRGSHEVRDVTSYKHMSMQRGTQLVTLCEVIMVESQNYVLANSKERT